MSTILANKALGHRSVPHILKCKPSKFMPYNFLIFILFSAFSGCSALSLNFNDQSRQEKDASKARLYHVVLCWLNEPGNEIHRKQIIEITKTFHKIPGVLDAQAGEVVMSDRDIVDDSYDVGILIVTKNENELQKYLDHPIHQKAKKDVLVPLVDKILVYDFKN
jgi:hypothetical protein